MKHQKYYTFLQKQILLMIGLSLIPGLVYVIVGWIFHIVTPALVWYGILLCISLYGWTLYNEFATYKMDENHLKKWYKKLTWFMYMIFSVWSLVFVMYVGYDKYHIHYIAIFTQLGAAVVASTLLISDKKLFVPILVTLMLPLTVYFAFIDTWYGYILSLFSLIFLFVLLYASFNTNRLLQKNYSQAQHDILTGLYNRRYFMEYMESLIERLAVNQKTACMFLIDLDHFKTINDSLGHDIGDKLLIEVSERLKAYAKDTHIVARLGGDEFILISKEFNEEVFKRDLAYGFSEGLLKVIRKPYSIDGHHLHISASIGVHQINPSFIYSKNFIREADIAMYEAKAQGRDGVIVFNQDLAKRVERHLLIEQKLHYALNENKIEVFYQPQFDKDEEVMGCEALIRWDDDELGRVGPEEFIPIVENTGLILEVGSYVLKETFESINRWNAKGRKLSSISVNISMRQLLCETFVNEVDRLIKIYFPKKESGQKIIFEITEHVFAEDMKKVINMMNRLKEIGISFSIDDFGTGYSSLSNLKMLPIDEVKIDRTFVARLDDGQDDKKMISTIISIAKNFDLNIVAEGIEKFEQLLFLIKIECDVFQGFYFEEPLSKTAFEEKYICT
ncbi:EAL domain-containing protein [Sulfurovum sp. XGS-02]|uniref:putative bifunctional diguanylate cyclase/phosphodiesterase n=1 Tax=Sulfurovum sp. XGS-02 TaxID=2925411 RepID=UPI0020492AA7|nr:EAL domain-containing protein [Sulfurovum sp. XGS-02]UPT76796.1 EAL domain-containing protein [Sulfurovum sp. XGS-02]